jgi:AraC-like DNA-binding protein
MKEVLETLFLLAAAQGFLLSIVLFLRKENHTANRILAIAALCLSIDLLSAVYYSKEWYKLIPHVMGISYPFPCLYGPLFYFYAKFVSKQTDRFRRIDWLHFLPAMIVYVLVSPIYFYSGESKIEFLNNMMRGIHQPIFSVFEGIIPVQGLFYTFLTILVVKEYDKNIKNTFSNTDLISLNWLKYVTIGMIVIWSIVALSFALRAALQMNTGINAMVQISISILIYFIGYKGLQQPEIFLNPSALSDDTPSHPEKYRRSGLSDDIAEEIKQKLKTVMTSEKLYLDNDLTLQKLADRMNISSHNLSEVINSKLNFSYYDFVNSHRVEEFKRRVGDPANDPYNLLSIAFDSGFKSKGTFNSIFKKFTGMTPSEYKSNVQSITQ